MHNTLYHQLASEECNHRTVFPASLLQITVGCSVGLYYCDQLCKRTAVCTVQYLCPEPEMGSEDWHFIVYLPAFVVACCNKQQIDYLIGSFGDYLATCVYKL